MDIKIYFFTYLTFMAGKVGACSTPYSYAQSARNPTSQLALWKEENFTLILKGSSPQISDCYSQIPRPHLTPKCTEKDCPPKVSERLKCLFVVSFLLQSL